MQETTKYKNHLLCNGEEEINNYLGTASKMNKYSALFTYKDAAVGQGCKYEDSYMQTKRVNQGMENRSKDTRV